MPEGIPIDCGSARIRPYHLDDLEDLLLQADHPQVAACLRDVFPHPYTRDDGKEWLELATGSLAATSFAIESSGDFAGGIGLMLSTGERRITAEVGYWLGPGFWGRGIATAAVSVFVPWVFGNHPEVIRLEAGVFESNPASARVLEKNGFHHEGTQVRSVKKGDRMLDRLLYVRFRDD
jgi:ribosomal-protein-alanine N-acetyltransferase